MLNWYVVHTKPRQEQRALENLEAQGYHCYLPIISVEKIRRQKLTLEQEPLFARYLFIELDASSGGKSWSPIRSTLGVSKLVAFGNEPVKVDTQLIELLREEIQPLAGQPLALHTPGDKVQIKDGPFAGLEAVYEMSDGEARAMVLIELLSKTTRLTLPITSITKFD
jgi:transcriptional antiterminator RfaH